MSDWARWVAIGAAAWFFATASYAGPKVGAPAPAFTVTTFGGRTVKLDDLRGDVVVLNFWATWCGPCKRELPLLESAFRAYSKYGFQVLAVATEDSVSERELRPLAAQLQIPLIKRLKGPYQSLDGVPTNYVIDRSGKLVYAKAAAFDADTLNALLIPLLQAEAPASPAASPSPVAASRDPNAPKTAPSSAAVKATPGDATPKAAPTT